MNEDKWSDSELLRLAATACGYSWNWEVEKKRYQRGIRGLWIEGISTFWNPIEYSGQALNLADSLNLNISYREGVASVGRLSEWVAGKPYCAANVAATRLAIVKAAAVIGGEKNRPDSKFYGEHHKWDSDGEHCEACGDKDWFAGPVCNPPIDLSGLVEHLTREANFGRFRLENELHQMSEAWVKSRWAHVANLERWCKAITEITTTERKVK